MGKRPEAFSFMLVNESQKDEEKTPCCSAVDRSKSSEENRCKLTKTLPDEGRIVHWRELD